MTIVGQGRVGDAFIQMGDGADVRSLLLLCRLFSRETLQPAQLAVEALAFS
jgi:hypothetical protein